MCDDTTTHAAEVERLRRQNTRLTRLLTSYAQRCKKLENTLEHFLASQVIPDLDDVLVETLEEIDFAAEIERMVSRSDAVEREVTRVMETGGMKILVGTLVGAELEKSSGAASALFEPISFPLSSSWYDGVADKENEPTQHMGTHIYTHTQHDETPEKPLGRPPLLEIPPRSPSPIVSTVVTATSSRTENAVGSHVVTSVITSSVCSRDRPLLIAAAAPSAGVTVSPTTALSPPAASPAATAAAAAAGRAGRSKVTVPSDPVPLGSFLAALREAEAGRVSGSGSGNGNVIAALLQRGKEGEGEEKAEEEGGGEGGGQQVQVGHTDDVQVQAEAETEVETEVEAQQRIGAIHSAFADTAAMVHSAWTDGRGVQIATPDDPKLQSHPHPHPQPHPQPQPVATEEDDAGEAGDAAETVQPGRNGEEVRWSWSKVSVGHSSSLSSAESESVFEPDEDEDAGAGADAHDAFHRLMSYDSLVQQSEPKVATKGFERVPKPVGIAERSKGLRVPYTTGPGRASAP